MDRITINLSLFCLISNILVLTRKQFASLLLLVRAYGRAEKVDVLDVSEQPNKMLELRPFLLVRGFMWHMCSFIQLFNLGQNKSKINVERVHMTCLLKN